jgi:methyl-accepting chemotaxis protein
MSTANSTASGIEEVLAERAPVLPILCTQLRQTAQQMDESVQGICASFVGISRRSKDGVARTARFLGTGDSGSGADANNLAGLLEGSKQTLRSLLERAAKTSAQSTLAVKRLDSVTTCSKQINTALASLNDMAIGNKLVAINARIEAARLGAQASGFNVVADEILAQTRLSTSIVETVRGLTKELNQAAATSIEILQSTVKEDNEALERSRREVEEALEQFGATMDAMRGFLDESAHEGEKLSADLELAIRGLQFQDRTNQRIQHVIEALEDMQNAIHPYVSRNGVGESEALIEMRRRYTMAEEHSQEHGAEVVSGEMEFL